MIPDAGTGVIHGCYDNSTGALRVIDPSNSSCSASETALNWNGRGSLVASKGDPGSDGATVLNGSGAPDDSLGNDGDFYIDTGADVIYGRRPVAAGPRPAPAWSVLPARPPQVRP